MWTEEMGVHRRSQENVAMERAEDQLLDGTTNVQVLFRYDMNTCIIIVLY